MAQKSCGCPSPGSAQDQAGWAWSEAVPARGRAWNKMSFKVCSTLNHSVILLLLVSPWVTAQPVCPLSPRWPQLSHSRMDPEQESSWRHWSSLVCVCFKLCLALVLQLERWVQLLPELSLCPHHLQWPSASQGVTSSSPAPAGLQLNTNPWPRAGFPVRIFPTDRPSAGH